MLWNESSISLEDVPASITKEVPGQSQEYGNFFRIPSERSDDWHIGRVIYFVEHPDEICDIDIDNMCDDGYIYPVPLIMDGNHRLMTAMYLQSHGKMDRISCSYGGREDLLDYLTGKTDECPLDWD